MFHCIQNFTFLKTVLSSILIGGSSSKVFLADPEQTLLQKRDRMTFTALHLVAWKVGINMTVYLKAQTVFQRNIYMMDLKLLFIAPKERFHVKETYVLLIKYLLTISSNFMLEIERSICRIISLVFESI